MILFSAVAVNHLELIANIERVVKHSLPVVNCPKCLSFWSVLAYGISVMALGRTDGIIPSLSRIVATALACSYLAIWLELLMGFIDTLYSRIYEQIYPTTGATADDTASAAGTVPEMWIDFGSSEGTAHPG